MKRKVWLLSFVLLAVGAMEFGLLGAASAGASFVPGWLASSKDGPPAARHGKPTPAPTPVSPPASPPCLPDREHAHDQACNGQPASIQLTPDPLTIECNGQDHSTLTVRITDARGQPVPDGTFVSFSAYDGNTSPSFTQTKHGVASTSVTFYGELFKSGPNVTVDAGALEAGVRIRCFPQSNQPPSPPPCPSSPPGGPCLPPPCKLSSPPSPPCPTPYPTLTPVPTPAPSIGGEISFGTPSLAAGEIVVPVLTSSAPDPWVAVDLHVTFDGSLLASTALQAGDVFQGVGSGYMCTSLLSDGGPDGAIAACLVIGDGSISNAGTLATITFTPQSATGCARLHLFTYGPPDRGGQDSGTYTMTHYQFVQENTYGPDITVDLATGATGCSAPPLPTVTPTPTWAPPPPSPPMAFTPTLTPTPTVSIATCIALPPAPPCDSPTSTATPTPPFESKTAPAIVG